MHDERNFTAIWVLKPKQRSFRVYRQFDVISNAMTNRRDAFVMVPPAEGYESALYSAELAPCKKVKFDAATLAPPADELEPPQPETPPKEAAVKVDLQTALASGRRLHTVFSRSKTSIYAPVGSASLVGTNSVQQKICHVCPACGLCMMAHSHNRVTG